MSYSYVSLSFSIGIMSSLKAKRKGKVADAQTRIGKEEEIPKFPQFANTQCIINKDSYFTWGVMYQYFKNGYYSQLPTDEGQEALVMIIY
jgi:hypothetical protein